MEKQQLTEKEIKRLSQNLDAVYVYLGTFIDDMREEELLAWVEILKQIDPNYQKREEDE